MTKFKTPRIVESVKEPRNKNLLWMGEDQSLKEYKDKSWSTIAGGSPYYKETVVPVQYTKWEHRIFSMMGGHSVAGYCYLPSSLDDAVDFEIDLSEEAHLNSDSRKVVTLSHGSASIGYMETLVKTDETIFINKVERTLVNAVSPEFVMGVLPFYEYILSFLTTGDEIEFSEEDAAALHNVLALPTGVSWDSETGTKIVYGASGSNSNSNSN